MRYDAPEIARSQRHATGVDEFIAYIMISVCMWNVNEARVSSNNNNVCEVIILLVLVQIIMQIGIDGWGGACWRFLENWLTNPDVINNSWRLRTVIARVCLVGGIRAKCGVHCMGSECKSLSFHNVHAQNHTTSAHAPFTIVFKRTFVGVNRCTKNMTKLKRQWKGVCDEVKSICRVAVLLWVRFSVRKIYKSASRPQTKLAKNISHHGKRMRRASKPTAN